MERSYYLDLARRGLRMPIGTDLLLHENPNPEEIKHDAVALGRVVADTARRYQTPLAVPLMDLTLEKADLLEFLGIGEEASHLYHFAEAPSAETVAQVKAAAARPFSPRITANQQAIRYVAEKTDLFPVGMLIGPFSLMTKLLDDPIASVAMAGAGLSGEEDASVLLAERALELAEAAVERSIRGQVAAGAKALLVCEPAANIVYISPRQLKAGSDVFERFVMQPNRRMKQVFEELGIDLIFHDCGELTRDMVSQFANELRPVILTLGASRKLWEDAAVVPKDVVLYGNLPTKTFYSDAAMPEEEVARRTIELVTSMAACGHPHILGSECDVLHVPESSETIRRKVDVMMKAGV
jgi:uroporphyrinogen-III decarboxylase